MTTASIISPWRAMALIVWRIGLELRRRKDVYVLLLLMGLLVLGVLVFRVIGIKAPATGTLLLNMGLSLAWFAAHLLTLLLAARQLPAELEHRTIYPLLARPIERGTLLAGLWLAATACGVLCWVALFVLAWGGMPKMEAYHTGLLVQVIALQLVSLGLMAALALMGSLLMPRAVNLLVLAGVWLGGDQVIGFLRGAAGDASASAAIGWVAGYVPDFSRLNLITRYTDGIGPLGAMEFIGLIAYGVLFIAASLALALLMFRRKGL